MERLALGLSLIGLGAAFVVLWFRLQAAAKARKASRAGYLDACQGLFRSGLNAVAETGFPRISGEYRGQVFDVQVVPDTLTFRKLPALWLLVTLPVALPLRASFDLMMRPNGFETYSHHARLPEEVLPPAGFPEGGVIRSDAAGDLPPGEVLRRHLAGLAASERFKELVVSPKGLRIVWLAEEANRGQYLLYRDAEMGALPLAPEVLRPLMDALLDLLADLEAGAPAGRSLSA